MTTAQKLKEAQEARASVYAKLTELRGKIDSETWDEEKDRPALENLKKELKSAEARVSEYTEAIADEQRSAGWTSTATAPPAQTENRNSTNPSVTILPEGSRGDSWEKNRKEYRVLKAIRELVMRNGLTGLEAEMYQEAERENRALGFSTSGNLLIPAGMRVPRAAEQRDMLAETTTAGGYTIQTDIGNLIPILEPRLVVQNLGATMLMGLTGNIDFPRNDADAVATWNSETGTADETSPTFDRLQLSPERLAAFTDVSKQVMIQSTIDMENFVRRRLNFAIGKAIDTAALQGSGSSNEPTGITLTSNISTVSAGNASLTWAKVVEFETNIATENADYGRLGYLFHPAVAGTLKTIKRDTAGNGFIWEGANNGAGTVNGYRALTSTIVQGGGLNFYTGFFGNWEELIVANWGGLDIMINPYTKAKEAIVEVVVNSWWDVGVKHPASFCVATDIAIS